MPKLKEFYEQNANLRDKFEIIAFHEGFSVKNFQELDEKIAPVERDVWKGKLPFPVLIDKEKATTDRYGIFAYPTIVLIDPEGKIVPNGSLEMLKAKLGLK